MSKWEHKRTVFEDGHKKLFPEENLELVMIGNSYYSHIVQDRWKIFCAAIDHMEAENEQLRQQLANKDAVISDDLNLINIMENEIRDLRNKIADLETWRSYAFRAHPNIDCDVAFEASRYKA